VLVLELGLLYEPSRFLDLYNDSLKGVEPRIQT